MQKDMDLVDFARDIVRDYLHDHTTHTCALVISHLEGVKQTHSLALALTSVQCFEDGDASGACMNRLLMACDTAVSEENPKSKL